MGLIVVTSLENRVPLARCLGCGTQFFRGEETFYERHVVRCAEKHDDEMRAESPRVQMPGLLDPFKAGDVELERWYRQNLALLREGRKRL